MRSHIVVIRGYEEPKGFLDDGKLSQVLIINGLEVIITCNKAKHYTHQNFAKRLCNTEGQLLTRHIGIGGYLYPGATIKHQAFSKTRFKETLERTIALLFAPIACLYFIYPKSRLYETKTQYCLVIPEIMDLKLYAEQRKKLNSWNYWQFSSSGFSDAGLRFISNQEMNDLAKTNNFGSCKVITFGRTKWTSFQKVRKRVEMIRIDDSVVHNYQLCDRYFNNRVVKWKILRLAGLRGSNKIGQSRTVSTIPGFKSAKLLVEKEKKTRFYL